MALKDLLNNINNITIEDAMLIASQGICFIIRDGKFKGFTK